MKDTIEMRVLAFGLAVSLCAPPACHGQATERTYPRYVLIIRHGEKPPDDAHLSGLSPAGVTRAKLLPRLFETSTERPQPFPKPDFIFAARSTKTSRRPLETASALGDALGLPVDATFREARVEALAQELFTQRKYEGKTILIVWHHGEIPELASALGATDAPRKWKDSSFDRVWVITYSQRGYASFSNRPEGLLSGDSRE